MVSAAFPNRPYWLREHVWLISQDVANNRSLVGWSLYIDGTWGSWSGGKAHRSMTLSGINVLNNLSNGFDFSDRSIETRSIGSGSTWISHNSDGTLTVSISAWADYDVLGYTSLTSSLLMPTIPRASTVTWETSGDKFMGTSYKLVTNRASSNFTHTLTYQFGGASGSIGTAKGVGAEINWTPPTSLANEIPNAATGWGTITTQTYNGNTLIGTTTSAIALTVPTSLIPDFTTITATEATPGVNANVGRFVQGISKLTLAITGAAGISGSSIVPGGYTINVKDSGGTILHTLNSVSGTTPVITASGTLTLEGTVTDSRGRTRTKTTTISVLPWSPPKINSSSVQRALSTGVANEQGTYLRVNINASISSLVNSTERNDLKIRISTKLRTDPGFTIVNNTDPSGTSYNSYILISTYNVDNAYDLLIEVYDDFATTAIVHTVATSRIFMHWGNQGDGQGLGVGKFWERGQLDVGGDIYANDQKVVTEDRAATTALAGIAPLASSADTATGTNNTKIITPAMLRQELNKPVRGRSPIITKVGAGTAVLGSDGIVTFTNITSLRLDNIFEDSDIGSYEISAHFYRNNGAGLICTRMRSGGVNLDTGYNHVGHYTRNASGPTRYSTFNHIEFGFWWGNFTTHPSQDVRARMRIFNPASSTLGTFYEMTSYVGASDRFLIQEGGDRAGAHDGMEIYCRGDGSFAGWLKIVKIV